MTSTSALWSRLLLIAALTAHIPIAQAGPGHDHGDAPPAAVSGGPQRLPDGAVFLPKSAQHRIGIRTAVGERQSLPRTVELPAEIRFDIAAESGASAAAAGNARKFR